MSLAKATLTEFDQTFENEKSGGQKVEVQFNPEALKDVRERHRAAAGRGPVPAIGPPVRRRRHDEARAAVVVDDRHGERSATMSAASRKRSLSDAPEVRRGFEEIAARSVPGCSFQGRRRGVGGTLKYFRRREALRASINLTLSQQKILKRLQGRRQVTRPGQPLKAAKQGDSLQNMAARTEGRLASIAAANGIEDPLRMAAGALVTNRAPWRRPFNPLPRAGATDLQA